MNNKSEKDYVSKLRPKIIKWPKIVILGLLLLVFVFSIILSSTNGIVSWSDFWINLAAGSVGSLLTVFFIDFLTNQERKSKLLAINKFNHYGLLSYVRIFMIRIMRVFGYVTKKEVLNYIDSSEEKFIIFIKDPKVIERLKNLNQLTPETLEFLKKVNKTLNRGWEYLSKNLSDFKPFPDPLLIHEVNTEMSYSAGTVSVGEDLLGFYFNQLPKKISKKEINKMQPGMSVLWKLITEGFEKSDRSYSRYYFGSFNLLIKIVSRCKKENVFIDI